jgi:alpha-ketoglutarate-dependent taurine dioxygenase
MSTFYYRVDRSRRAGGVHEILNSNVVLSVRFRLGCKRYGAETRPNDGALDRCHILVMPGNRETPACPAGIRPRHGAVVTKRDWREGTAESARHGLEYNGRKSGVRLRLAPISLLAHGEIVFSGGSGLAMRDCAEKTESRSGTVFAVSSRLSPGCGVRIDDVDLSVPLSAALKGEILGAFRDHHVVVFPKQKLTREQQFSFSQNFGQVEAKEVAGKRHGVAHVISNLDAEGQPVDRSSSLVSNYRWHTDKAYHSVPPMMTTLYAVDLPMSGGDTEFANTVLGYSALPIETRRRINGLRVVFRWGAGLAAGTGKSLPESALQDRKPVDHPLVRTHPDTGSKALYLGNHSSHIVGLSEDEGRALLDRLLEHTTQRQFVYTHRWHEGDLVIWDNRCLLHRAVANYRLGQERRVLHRTVVRGTVPV